MKEKPFNPYGRDRAILGDLGKLKRTIANVEDLVYDFADSCDETKVKQGFMVYPQIVSLKVKLSPNSIEEVILSVTVARRTITVSIVSKKEAESISLSTAKEERALKAQFPTKELAVMNEELNQSGQESAVS